MYLLYSLLLTFGFVLLLPRFALDAFRTRKYVTALGERLGQLPNFKIDGPTIWLNCVSFGFVLLLPRFALDAFRTRKYVTGLGERLGQLPNFKIDGPTIWLHCVSVGETEAAKPLVRALNERFPNYRLVVSTTTVTGQRLARTAFAKNAAAVFYFPIDWTWVAGRVLRKVDPAAVLIMETELWPNFLRECRRRSIPVAIVNGRISQKSSRRYQMIRGFVRR